MHIGIKETSDMRRYHTTMDRKTPTRSLSAAWMRVIGGKFSSRSSSTTTKPSGSPSPMKPSGVSSKITARLLPTPFRNFTPPAGR